MRPLMRRHLEAFGITPHAQTQTVKGIDVTFQPEHLGCDSCWELAPTSFVESRIFNGGHVRENEHGMTTTLD